MKLYMTDRRLLKLAISAHNTAAADWTPPHSAYLSLLVDELERRGYEPRITTTLSFERTHITRGGDKP